MANEKTIEQLPCKLSGEEKLMKGDQLVRLAIEVRDLEAEKKAAGATFKTQIDEKKERMNELCREIHSGEELRPIECMEHPRYDRMIVDIIRTDLGTVWKQRPLHPSERQLAMETGRAPMGTVTPIGSSAAKKKKPSSKKPIDDSPSDTH
jgi:hypothetical protein